MSLISRDAGSTGQQPKGSFLSSHLVEVVDHVIRQHQLVLNRLILSHLVQLQAMVGVVAGRDGWQGRARVEGGVAVVTLQPGYSFLLWTQPTFQGSHRIRGTSGTITTALVVVVVVVRIVAMAVSAAVVVVCVMWVYGAKRAHGIEIISSYRCTHGTHGTIVVGPATATTL